MTLGAIGSIALPTITPVARPASFGTDSTAASSAAGGGSFAAKLGQGLEHLQQTQAKADELSVQAATGQLTDVHDYMIASNEAALVTELTVAVRNKAVDAFNEIMRMQA